MLFCAKENKYIMLFGVHIQFQDMHFFNKIKETNIIQIQRVRNCDKSIRYALMVLEFNFFMVSHVLRYSDIKFEYSCAVTPQVRQTGNRLSGLAGTAYASLLT